MIRCPSCGQDVDELIQPIGELEDICHECAEESGADFPDEVLAVAGLSRDEI